MSDSLWPHDPRARHAPLSFTISQFAQIHVLWVSDAIQPSHPLLPFSCPQSFPAWVSFPMSQLFASGGHISIRASALASVLLMNIQDWFPLGLTGLNSLQFKGLLRVFSNIIVQKHQFFGAQLSLRSNSHIHTLLLEKFTALIYGPLSVK